MSECVSLSVYECVCVCVCVCVFEFVCVCVCAIYASFSDMIVSLIGITILTLCVYTDHPSGQLNMMKSFHEVCVRLLHSRTGFQI